MALYKLDWLYNILGEMQEHPRATLTSVHNQIKNEIRTLQRDDDRAGELEEYLSVMFYAYVETLDEQDRWRNNPDDINGTCSVAYAQREGFLKYLISAAADIKRACHVEVSRAFIEQWRGFISKRGNRLPDEQLGEIAPLTASSNTPQQHFTPTLKREQYTDIFNRLMNNRYIASDTTLEQWLIVCGIEEDGDCTPINWIVKANLLAVLADYLFDTDRANIWQLVEKNFLCKGKKPNNGTLKNYLSKVNNDYKNKTEGHDELVELLRT